MGDRARDSIDHCQHDEVLRMELADGSHDWQCVNCGALFALIQSGLAAAEAGSFPTYFEKPSPSDD